MLITKNKFNKLDIITLFLNIFLIALSFYDTNFSKYLLLSTLWTNIILLYKSRNQKSFLLMFIFWISYILLIMPAFFLDLKITGYRDYQDIYYFSLTLIIHSIFLNVFNIFFKAVTFVKDPKLRIRIKDNFLFFYFTVLIMIFIVIFGRTGTNIFSAGGYGNVGVRDLGGLAINEYFYIFFYFSYKIF